MDPNKVCESKAYLGNLYGNEFHIVLRDVDLLTHFQQRCRESKVKQANKSVRNAIEVINTVGFINYFGLQRFGTGDIPTHLVGKALLRENWKEAVDLIMTGKDGERQDVAEARNAAVEILAVHEAYAALHEYRMDNIKSLSKYENVLKVTIATYFRLFGCISRPSRHLRQLYKHACQSYVWNRLVSPLSVLKR